ncbi:hypothetical protein EXIGLDRAFT_724396 [Exidia glandulosa HHB12029]|uniref:Uncharacterized protein n=1 Tax=Exidia glandulosa HHB12029 TaxID=1314781 RepID=A0A165EFH9_EXIGL|nr:hypothetical protein EXIGLDRAFT_724396 [Exidia glandulosa HHB12029]
MFNSSGDPDTARVIAGAVLRALAQSAPDRRTLDPLSRVRAASVAVSLAYAEDEAPTAWPFMAWAMTEACDNPLGPEDSREFASLSYTVRWDGISWAEWKGRMDDVLPLQIAVYEKYFMTRPYFAADILNDLIVGYISHDELYVAEQLMFRANRLGRIGMALSRHHEPDSGIRIRVTTILYAAQLCEWVADYEAAEQRYLIAREMTRRNLHKVGPRWLQACEAGLLRSRLQTQRVSDWTFAEDFDDEPEY